MAILKNCDGTTRRDCLKLGLGGLVAGGFLGSLEARAIANESAGKESRGRRVHFDLAGWRSDPLRDFRPQAFGSG